MSTRLGKFLDEQFKAAGRHEATARDRAGFLQTEAASYSKVLTGTLPLTPARAAKWAVALFPNDEKRRAHFVSTALEAPRVPTILEFCDSIVDANGAVPVERIAELFDALQNDEVQNPLICCEYRDAPRAARETKYEQLGSLLVKAIANRVSFAMFQPFVSEGFKHSDKATRYMTDIRDACRLTYRAYRRDALDLGAGERIDNRLRLYERSGKSPYIGSGFQGKLFYVQWQSGLTIKVPHSRIFQWVATPLQDLLVYRGEIHIPAAAVRDSFYPVVQYFEATERLPGKFGASTREEIARRYPERQDEPSPRDEVWEVYSGGDASK